MFRGEIAKHERFRVVLGLIEQRKHLSGKVGAYVLIDMWSSDTRINSRELLKGRFTAKHVVDIGLVFPWVSKIDLNKMQYFDWCRPARVCARGLCPVFWQRGHDNSGLALRMLLWSSASVSAGAGCDQRTAFSQVLGRGTPRFWGKPVLVYCESTVYSTCMWRIYDHQTS